MTNRRRAHSAHLSGLLHATQYSLFNIYDRDEPWSEGLDLNEVRWMRQAICTDVDPDVFYRNESVGTTNYLRPICADCPVQPQCLQYALAHDERGWWGGTSERERRAYKRQATSGSQP